MQTVCQLNWILRVPQGRGVWGTRTMFKKKIQCQNGNVTLNNSSDSPGQRREG
ncbi:unnamed protein product, partial [Candidula unifasciata]